MAWKGIRHLINLKRNDNVGANAIYNNNKLINDPQEIANILLTILVT